MMLYEEVVELIKGQGYDVSLQNGRDGKLGVAFPLHKEPNGASMCALIYFDDFAGITDPEELASTFVSIIKTNSVQQNTEDAIKLAKVVLADKDKAFDRLTLCLRPRKKDHTDGEVYRDWLDLEQYCRVDNENMTVAVTEALLKEWNVTEDEVFERATLNSKKNEEISVFNELFRAIMPVKKVAFAKGSDRCFVKSKTEDYGASALCDTELFHKISVDNDNIDLFIVPISIHQLVIWPCQDILLGCGHQMLEQAWRLIRKEERLATHAYVYSSKEDKVIIPEEEGFYIERSDALPS